MPLNQSRYKRRMDYLTKDPSGPRQKRLDVLLDKEDYALFQKIMDYTNERRRDALHTMLRERYDAIMKKNASSAKAKAAPEHKGNADGKTSTPWGRDAAS